MAQTSVGLGIEAPTEAQVAALTDQLVTDHLDSPPQEFWGAQFDLGLAWVHFPEGKGGLGLDPGFQEVIDERLIAAHAPHNLLINMMGVGMAGPTLVAF